jgi:hypothetical protein
VHEEEGGIMLKRYVISAILLMLMAGFCAPVQTQSAANKFEVVEATIADIQNAIKAKRLTATELVNGCSTHVPL